MQNDSSERIQELSYPLISKVKELSALKIISKDRLHADDIKVMRGEARVLEMLEGRPNIVQLKNVSAIVITV